MMNIAQMLAKSVRAMVPGRFEAISASPESHSYVDWKAYHKIREAAASLGFRHLGDIEAVSHRPNDGVQNGAVYAVYVSKDGTTLLGHYRLVPRWTLQGIIMRLTHPPTDFFDVETTFGEGDDRIELATTNAKLAGVWSTPAFILRETMDTKTPLLHVVKRHQGRVAKYRAGRPDVQPTVIESLEQVIANNDATERRKREWRRAFGWASKDEISRVTKLQGSALDSVYDSFKKLVRGQEPASAAEGAAAPAAAAAATAPDTSGLQFDRILSGSSARRPSKATMACTTCTMPITESYYDVDGHSVCAECKNKAVRENEPARGAGAFFKAFFYGGIAAVLGAAIYYAFAAFLNIEWALVTIIIGFMVGAAIRKGTDGKGGRKYQVMAVFLTYVAVGLAFTPFAVQGIMESAKSDSVAARDSLARAQGDSSRVASLSPIVPPPAAERPAGDSATVSLAGDTGAAAGGTLPDTGVAIPPMPGAVGVILALAIGLVAAFVGVLVLPVFAVLSSLPSGILTAVIVGFGMVQAWKMTAATVHTVSGPYRVGESASAPPEAPPAAAT